MKKRILLSLSVLLILLSCIGAAGVREVADNESIVKVICLETYQNGVSDLTVLKRDGSTAVYHIWNDTELEGIALEDIKEGMILVVGDTGIATMSIPPQLSATSIRDITLASSLGFYDSTFASPVAAPAISEDVSDEIPFDINELVPRFSYAYGYLSMDNLMMQNLTVRGDYFARGIIDAIDLTNDVLLSFDEMMMVTQEYFTTVYEQGIIGDEGEMVTSVEDVEALGLPETLEEEFAYAYGYILTFQIMSQGIELDRIAFPYGMLNRLYNEKALLTTDEMNAAIEDYIAYLNQVITEYIQQMAGENLKEAEAFLAENAKNENIESISDLLQLEFTARSQEESAMPSAESSMNMFITCSLSGKDAILLM